MSHLSWVLQVLLLDLFPFYDSDTCNVQATAPLPNAPLNEGFNKEQTLFLIHLMGIHLEVEGEGPAKSLNDLNRRLRLGKKTKRRLWEEMAVKLSRRFKERFQKEKVARKWLTLVEGYKKCKDINTLTGRGPVRFQFYTEMDELIGGSHDVVDPPVVGRNCAGVVIRRPDAPRPSSRAPSPASADEGPPSSPCNSESSAPPTRAPSATQSPSPSSTPPASPSPSGAPAHVPTTPSGTPRSPKRQRLEDDLLALLERSNAAALADARLRHEESMAEIRLLRESRSAFIQLFSRMVDKQ